MASKKSQTKRRAPRGDAAGMAAIRMWSMDIESAMIRRYVGNAPTLPEIRKIAVDTVSRIQRIKPAMMSDCHDWKHRPNCECVPVF